MCMSSLYVAWPSVILTGSLPIGVILWPLTVRGVTREGSRLSLWSARWLSLWSARRVIIRVPATDMSAPESGRG